jgi:hypothetical protein
MPEIRLDQAVENRLDDLWQRGQDALVGRLEDAIEWIGDSDPRSRAHRFLGSDRPEGAWVIAVTDSGTTWVIVWTEEDDGTAVVHDIGQTELL